MKRRSRKATQQSAKKQTVTASTSQAESSSAGVTAAAVSGRQRRFTAKRALEMLQNLPDTDSGSDESETNDESDSSVQLSQVSSEDDEDDDVASQTDAESTSRTVTVPAVGTTQQNKATTDADKQTVAKDGTKWTVVSHTALTGRFQSQNVFTSKPGPTAYARTLTRPVDAFRLLIDEGMLRHIKRCTVEFAQMEEPTWDTCYVNNSRNFSIFKSS